MQLQKLHKLASQLPGVTQDIKWEDHLCYNIGGKMFLVTSPDKSPVTASFKVTAEEFDELCEREGISPAPYLARYKWVFVDDLDRFSEKEWTHFVNQAYQLIFSKLSKKVQQEISDQ